MLYIRLITVGAAFGLLCGCGQETDDESNETALEAAAGGNAEIERHGSTETVTFRGPDADTTISTGTKLGAPANYPEDGFIPPNAEITTSVVQGDSLVVVYLVPGLLSDVFHRSQEALYNTGWKQSDMVSPESGSAFAAYEKEERVLSEQFTTQADGRVEVRQMFIVSE